MSDYVNIILTNESHYSQCFKTFTIIGVQNVCAIDLESLISQLMKI